MPKKKAYEIQTIKTREEGKVTKSYRITHAETDSRIATCDDWLNADLVTDALNAYDPLGKCYP